jgi:hypothetical protein
MNYRFLDSHCGITESDASSECYLCRYSFKVEVHSKWKDQSPSGYLTENVLFRNSPFLCLSILEVCTGPLTGNFWVSCICFCSQNTKTKCSIGCVSAFFRGHLLHSNHWLLIQAYFFYGNRNDSHIWQNIII